MDKLIPAVKAKLDGDAILSNLVSEVRYWRSPRQPESLIKPVVVFSFLGLADKAGHHGATMNPMLEINVWAYDRQDAQIIEATKAATRISDVLATGRLEIEGGGTTRVSLNTGWLNRNSVDPNTIQLLARFTTSYWSPSRIDLLK